MKKKSKKRSEDTPLSTGLWRSLNTAQRQRLIALGFDQQSWDNNVKEVVGEDTTGSWPLRETDPFSLRSHDRAIVVPMAVKLYEGAD